MKHSIIGAACVGLLIATSGPAQATPISGQGTWESTLQGRDLDGNFADGFEAYYDTVLNITWLANANYAGTSMNWATAKVWAASLNPYGSGITGWRLPTTTDTGTTGCNYGYTGTDCGYNVDMATGEMAHMFYGTLGNRAYYSTSGVGPQLGWGLSNTGPFSNIQYELEAGLYWSDTEYSVDTSRALAFSFLYGLQGDDGKHRTDYAWAVHDGDVGTLVVPLPAAFWLFGSGVMGLLGVMRKRSALA